MPGSYGYTGQHDDTALTGLILRRTLLRSHARAVRQRGYGARRAQPPRLCAGNPENFTDPSGHVECESDTCGGGGGGGGGRGGAWGAIEGTAVDSSSFATLEQSSLTPGTEGWS